MLIILTFVLPTLLLILSIALTYSLSFTGALIATFANTVYYCVFIALLSGVGHPNSVVMKVRWRKEVMGIVKFLLANLVLLFTISGLFYWFQQ
jgi:hypothetical protein